MAEETTHPIRLMNFVSEEQLQESKKLRGERVEDGTAQRDRPLYEILKENKDKKDAEFNERFKHKPPKALDEDETDFLDRLEMTRREYEKQMADEEAQELQSFQAAVAAQSSIIQELKEAPPAPPPVEPKQAAAGKKNPPSRPLNVIVKVKKAKIDPQSREEASERGKSTDFEVEQPLAKVETVSKGTEKPSLIGLVSYSDESDED